MAADRSERQHPPEDDILPDEREVIAERASDLDELDDEDYLSVSEVAENLDLELD